VRDALKECDRPGKEGFEDTIVNIPTERGISEDDRERKKIAPLPTYEPIMLDTIIYRDGAEGPYL
jgi:hypothetical protein